MPFDPKADARAALLAGSLAGAEIAPTPFHLRARAAAIRSIRSLRAPLDLAGTQFRYLVLRDGTIEPVQPIRVVARPRPRHRVDVRPGGGARRTRDHKR